MSDALLEAFKTAATTPGKDENGKDLYIAAILKVIEDNAATLLQGGYEISFNKMPAGQGRHQAIAIGLKERLDLFGDFQDVDALKIQLEYQVEVEFMKYSFINAIDGAADVGAMKDAIKDYVGPLSERREQLIHNWEKIKGNAALDARVEQLKVDPFTVVLAKIASRLNSDDFVSDFAARLFEARDAQQGDKFYGVYAIVGAMDAAADAIDAEAIAQFNSATDAAQVLTAIDAHIAKLLDFYVQDEYAKIPDGSGRQTAIADGILEIKKFFGAFTSRADLVKALELQVSVEYNKYDFITQIDTARSPDAAKDIATILANYVNELNDQRQDLITEWGDIQNNAPLAVRVAELKADPYTIILDALSKRLDDDDVGAFLAALTAKFVTTRGDGHYYGVWTLADALDKAGDAVDAIYAFNSATTATEILAAITTHGDDLLDDDGEAQYAYIPSPSGRQTAIADGILEIKKFFGEFQSEADLAEALQLQVSVEYNKLKFIRAVDEADADTMVTALVEWVDDLNAQRQELIADWKEKAGANPNPALSARIAALESETYTLILKEVYDRRNEVDFLKNVAAKLLAARNAIPGDDKHFYSVVKIVEAMDKAVDELDTPTAEPTQSVSMNEDTVLIQAIGASDPNDDPLTYTTKPGAGPKKGTVTFDEASGKFTYTPLKDMNGTDTFTILISDGPHTIEQTVTITINPVNDAPFDISLSESAVNENSVAGTPVGELRGLDLDGGVLTFTLLDDAGGRFAIETKDGVTRLVVKDGAKLDYEQAMFHIVKVQVTDASNATYVETLVIDVNDIASETLTGTASADVLKGNAGQDVFKAGAGNDKLYGGADNDTLWGGSGNDIIWGGLGKDTLKGEAGKDIFVFDTKPDKKTNVDKILDFKVKDDSIWLDNAVFTKLGKKGSEVQPAQLNKAFFTIGSKAKDKNDYIIYNNKKGVLYYDADGSGSKAKQVEFATLSKDLKMTYKDFFVI